MSGSRDPAVEAFAESLDRGLKRAQQAIDEAARRNAKLLDQIGQASGATWLGELGREGLEPTLAKLAVSRRLEKFAEKQARKHARWQAREERKRLRREAEERVRAERMRAHGHNPAMGAVMLVSAAAMGAMAFIDHSLWWLVFPAFAIGTGGASMFGSPASKSPATPSASAEPELDPRDARVDAVCAKIAAELASATPAVKDLVGQSAKSIEQLRATCRSLTQRERELRALANPQDDARLLSEREALAARIANESDEVVRARLQGALEQLDQQRKERGALSVAAARFEAEHTRIGYTLESLHAQIVRMKSASSAAQDPAGAAVRQSLQQLGEELDAVAEALESVNRGELSPVAEVGAPAAKRSLERA